MMYTTNASGTFFTASVVLLSMGCAFSFLSENHGHIFAGSSCITVIHGVPSLTQKVCNVCRCLFDEVMEQSAIPTIIQHIVPKFIQSRHFDR